MSTPALVVDEGSVLHGYLGVLRARLWSILLVTAFVTGAAGFFAARQTPIYQSVAVVQATNPTGAITSSLGSATAPVMPTEQALVQAQVVTDCAWLLFEAQGGQPEKLCGANGLYAAEMSTADPPPSFRSNVDVSVPQGTTLLHIAFNSENRRLSQAGARSFARAYVWHKLFDADVKVEEIRAPLLEEQATLQAEIDPLNVQLLEAAAAEDTQTVSALQTQVNALNSSLRVVEDQLLQTSPAKIESPVIVGDPLVPADPVSPNVELTVAFGLLAGLGFGVAQALLREQLDRRLRGREDLERRIGASVLAVVPRVKRWRKHKTARLVSAEDPRGTVAEAYRALRTSLLFQASQRGLHSFIVTSALPGEGKSVTTANLGVVLADAGKRVVLVSCDLRKPRLHQFFGLEGRPGLTDVLSGEVDIAEALLRTGRDGLRVIGSGSSVEAPAEMLHSPQMSELVHDLQSACDFLILDTPPLLSVADALALVPLVGGVVYVADAGSTAGHAVRSARALLDQVHAKVVGAVFNNFDPSKSRATLIGQYGYGYGPTSVDPGRDGSPDRTQPIDVDSPAG